MIGSTPLVEIKSLSRLTGCTILAKAEHLNPGGSSKDRSAPFYPCFLRMRLSKFLTSEVRMGCFMQGGTEYY